MGGRRRSCAPIQNVNKGKREPMRRGRKYKPARVANGEREPQDGQRRRPMGGGVVERGGGMIEQPRAMEDSSDSEVEVVRTKVPLSGMPRVKRRRILHSDEIANVPIYSNKVNSSLKFYEDNPTELTKQLKQVLEDVDSDGFGSMPRPICPSTGKSLVYELTDSEEETQEECNKEPERNKSPSPPPSPRTPKRRRGRAYKKIREVDAKLKDLDLLRSPTNLPFQEDDVILVETNVSQEITLKVRRHSSMYRLTLQMSDSLHKVVDQMASTLKVNPNQILLMLRDEELLPSATLRSLKLTIADIIDCVVLSTTVEQNAEDEESIALKIQGQEKQSHLTVTVRRNEPLKILMDKYRQAKGLQGRKISFLFEGQKLTGKATPEQLGMEPDDVIELWV